MFTSRTSLRLAALAILAVLAGGAGAAVAAGLRIPAYETVILENGLTVNLMRHAAVPLVSIEMWTEAGAAADARGREGLANLTASALRKGAGAYNAEGFAEALDFLGAEFESEVNQDRVRIRMELLARDLDAGLALLSDAVMRPHFTAAEIEKLAGQMADAVAEAKDRPGDVIRTFHLAHLYGEHRYGNPPEGTEESLAKLTREDVLRFYRTHYGADRSYLSIVGDIDPQRTERAVRETFREMPKAEGRRVHLVPPQRPTSNRVLLVNKDDTPQTWFCIGSLGPSWDSQDYAAAEVVRMVFGGRFTSWLNTKLRIENGLTYSASYIVSRRRVAGPAYIASYTPTETTQQAIDLALAQLDRLREEGLGAADLASAKAYLKGQLPYEYETAADLALAITNLSLYGLDRSFVDGLIARIDAVDQQACARAIDQYFRGDNLVFTAIGVAAEVRSILADYGELRVREIDATGFH